MVLPPNQGCGIATVRQRLWEACEWFSRSLTPRQEHAPKTEGEKHLDKSIVYVIFQDLWSRGRILLAKHVVLGLICTGAMSREP